MTDIPVQRPPSRFARIGMPEGPGLDRDALEQAFLERSREVHPDRFVGKLAAEQRKALIASAQLNEAYTTLKDERLRLEHLLELRGGKRADQDKRTPQSFLLEMLETREALESAQQAGDEPALERFREQATRERRACLDRIAALFGDDELSADTLEAIRLQLNVVKYWESMLQELASAPVA